MRQTGQGGKRRTSEEVRDFIMQRVALCLVCLMISELALAHACIHATAALSVSATVAVKLTVCVIVPQSPCYHSSPRASVRATEAEAEAESAFAANAKLASLRHCSTEQLVLSSCVCVFCFGFLRAANSVCVCVLHFCLLLCFVSLTMPSVVKQLCVCPDRWSWIAFSEF